MNTTRKVIALFTMALIVAVCSYSTANATAKQLDFMMSSLQDVSGVPLSGAIVVTRNSANSAAKAVWDDKDQTLPSALGKSQFSLDSEGRATVFGDGVYTILIYDEDDTGLTTPLYTFSGVTYLNIGGIGTVLSVGNYVSLRAIEGVDAGDIVAVAGRDTAGDDGGGHFVWDDSDLEAEVSADSQSGIYVAPDSDLTGVSGAWVRQYASLKDRKWYGVPSFTFYVSTAGDDADDGLTVSTPFLTIQQAIDTYEDFRKDVEGCTIKLAAGTYTEGGIADELVGNYILTIDGDSKATTILDGTTSTNTNGLYFNACSSVLVSNLSINNWTTNASSGGVVFSNGTVGTINTVDMDNITQFGLHANQEAVANVIGVCSISNSENGIQYRKNSSGVIGDGTNTVTLSDTALGIGTTGVRVRDASVVNFANGVVISNKTVGIYVWKNSYAEVRTATFNDNKNDIFADNNSTIAPVGPLTHNGTIENEIEYAGFSTNYDEVSSKLIGPNGVTGDTPLSADYLLLFDNDGNAGIQALLNDNFFYIDANTSERITFDAGSSTMRFRIGSTDLYRMRADAFIPIPDGTQDLGTAPFQWRTMYAVNASVISSDERRKQQIRSLTAAEGRVATALKGMFVAFKLNSDVERDAAGAKIHFGVLAQEVVAAFVAEGLDPDAYSMIYYEDDIYGIRYTELICFIIANM